MKVKLIFLLLLVLVVIVEGLFLWKCHKRLDANHHRNRDYNNPELIKTEKIGYGVIYDSLITVCEDDKVVDFGFILKYDSIKNEINSDSVILFINQKDIRYPVFNFNDSSALLIKYEIHTLKFKDFNMQIGFNPVAIGDTIPVDYGDIDRDRTGSKNQFFQHRNGNIHDPIPPTKYDIASNHKKVEYGFLLGEGHLFRCRSGNTCRTENSYPKMLLYFDDKAQGLVKFDTVCYETISVSMLGESIPVAIDLQKVTDLKECYCHDH